MKRAPLISVVVAAYNCEAYIGDALSSVLQEDEDLEVLVVNDGSKDRTEDVVKSVRDPRVRYFSQANSGVAPARNLAIQKSRGDFLMVLDADDLALPNALKIKREFLADNPQTSLVLGNQYYLGLNGDYSWTLSNTFMSSLDPYNLLVLLCRRRGTPMPDNQPMWRKSDLKKTGLYRHIFGEDVELYIRALLMGMRPGFLTQLTGFYRENRLGLSSGGNWSRFFPETVPEARVNVTVHRKALAQRLFGDEVCPIRNDDIYMKAAGEVGVETVVQRHGRFFTFRFSPLVVRVLNLINGQRSVKELVPALRSAKVRKEALRELLFDLFMKGAIFLKSPDQSDGWIQERLLKIQMTTD